MRPEEKAALAVKQIEFLMKIREIPIIGDFLAVVIVASAETYERKIKELESKS